MSIAEDLKNFDFDRTAVVQDTEKFRMKLQIGSDAFKTLTQLKTVGKGGLVALSGGGAWAMSYAAWYASLGSLAKLGLFFGVVSTPGGWLLASGTFGAALMYGALRIYSKVKRATVVEVPLFINTPVDILGASICALFCPVLLRIAHADDSFEEQERALIKDYFVRDWGISERYIDQLIHKVSNDQSNFTYGKLRAGLKKAQASGDIKYEIMADEIIRTAESVMNLDGTAHHKEVDEFDKLRHALLA